MTLRTAQQHGQAYIPRLLEYVQKGQLDPSPLATHYFSLDDGALAYEMFKKKQDGLVRDVFRPDVSAPSSAARPTAH